MTTPTQPTVGSKTFKAQVVSDKMQNTAVVQADMKRPHPLYKKIIKRRKKFFAHNTIGAKLGDQVTIKETRPLSKLKRFIIVSIDKQAEKIA